MIRELSIFLGLRLLPLIVIITGLFAGCATEECYDNKNALPYAGFYGVMEGKMEGLSIDSVMVYGLGAPGDSILSDGKKRISNLYLPFRIDKDTTAYVFRLINRSLGNYIVSDTVKFVYDLEPVFVSAACGVSYRYKIKEISNSGILIDSVICPGNVITNADRENLKIYFNTGEEAI